MVALCMYDIKIPAEAVAICYVVDTSSKVRNHVRVHFSCTALLSSTVLCTLK